jgi:hypothetical protein
VAGADRYDEDFNETKSSSKYGHVGHAAANPSLAVQNPADLQLNFVQFERKIGMSGDLV